MLMLVDFVFFYYNTEVNILDKKIGKLLEVKFDGKKDVSPFLRF